MVWLGYDDNKGYIDYVYDNNVYIVIKLITNGKLFPFDNNFR